MQKPILAVVAAAVLAFAANPAFAGCAEELAKVKEAVSKVLETKNSHRWTADVKLQEAEAALARKDEIGCMEAVKAAAATIR